MASKIDPACEFSDEVKRVLIEQLETAMAKSRNRRLSVEKRVHASRVAIKKCRAALKLIRSRAEGQYTRENRALARAVRRLGELRDAAVRVKTFDSTLRHFGASRKKYEQVRMVLTASHHGAMPAKNTVEHELRAFGRRLRPVRKRIAAWDMEVSTGEFAADFARTYCRAREACQKAVAKSKAVNFHEWRKAAKAHYYQCRLLRAVAPKHLKAVCAALKDLGTLLGEEHDLTLLKLFLKKRCRREAAGVNEGTASAFLTLLEERRKEVRTVAASSGSRLFARKPRTVKKRIAAWWTAH